MWTALLSKELRECVLYAGVALLAQVHFLGAGMDLPLIPLLTSPRGNEIPFLSNGNSNLEGTFTMIAVLIAIVLGLHQSMWESWRQTSLFLLHRPLPLVQIFLAKLLTGTSLVMAVTVIPLGVYCLWAATPNTHASPFFWSMTALVAQHWCRCGLLSGCVFDRNPPRRMAGFRAPGR